ncbi:MAG: hypothetical protein D6733_01475 [Methanobacteriota archaeon]|nr:MAG: hypothetical protein D6733_01475 [Euryarchaeota archaeon]
MATRGAGVPFLEDELMEEEKLLTVEELTKQIHGFKTRWYGLVKKAEKLTDFKSGFEEGFKKAVEGLYTDVDACKDDVDSFEHHLKHYFPGERSDITWMTKKVFRHLEDLRVLVKRDYDVLEGSKGLAEELKGLTEEMEKAEAKLKEAEAKSAETCGKYFDMKNDYTRELQGIEDRINKQLDKVRAKFVEMTTPIVEGHEILLASNKMTIDGLFEHLTEKPEDTEKISLVLKKGGFFGKKAEADLAKTSVLKYVSSEILEGVAPVMKEKRQLLSKLESDYSELPRLEKACEEAEKERKKLERPVEDLKEKIAQIRKSEVFKFADYDGILDTREQYLDKIGEAEPDVKAYLDFALLHLKGFEELEPDVEKRNLLAERKDLKEKVVALEKEAAKAREELSAKVAEVTTLTAAKEGLEKRLGEAEKQVKALEAEKEALMERLAVAGKKLAEFEGHLRASLEKFQTAVESRLGDVTAAMDTGKGAAERKVGKKVDTLRGKGKAKK